MEQQLIDKILTHEVSFKRSRSGGPGGQNVNKVETKVALIFTISTSNYLDDKQKQRLIELAAKKGYLFRKQTTLIIDSESQRNQAQNKETVVKYFQVLLQKALTEPKLRTKTKAPTWVKEEIHQEKLQKSRIKSLRQKPKILNA